MTPSRSRGCCSSSTAVRRPSRASAGGAVDVDGLRDLAADDACRRGGYGGIELLDSAGGAGWSLVASLLGPYAERPSAAAASVTRSGRPGCSGEAF